MRIIVNRIHFSYYSSYSILDCPDDLAYAFSFETQDVEFIVELVKQTQSTLSISCTIPDDETWSLKEIHLEGNKYDAGEVVTFAGLKPGETYIYSFTASFDNKDIPLYWNDYPTSFTKEVSLRTLSLNPQISISPVTPTTALVKCSYDIGDFDIAKTDIECNGQTSDGKELLLIGLEPEKQYEVSYRLKTCEDIVYTGTSQLFTTPALKMTVLQPKSVSGTCAIISARTNISEEETGAGFQWKKYDAPESLNPSEGYAAVYDGLLEGYIKRLQPAFYYNVRAFYKSATGRYYYSNWVTFDPSDFSYFEPTVHTYPVQEVSHNFAKVKGYVMAGTDEIQEQGFQYWPSETSENKARSVLATDVSTTNVTTVIATGQVMTIVIDGLKPSTTYCCRAFVKTVSGLTYGEKQTFTTNEDTTGMIGLEAEAVEPEFIGYYDMNGRKLNALQKGLNIVCYSDGSTRKILVK